MNSIPPIRGVGQSGTPGSRPAQSHFRRYSDAGFTPDMLPIIPPDAEFSGFAGEGTRANAGKIPGRKVGKRWVGFRQWQDVFADEQDVESWAQWNCGIGIHCRRVVAFDVDVTDKEASKAVHDSIVETFGAAPVRVGLPPKHLHLYRLPEGVTIAKRRIAFTYKGEQHAVEILGSGQQFVAEGVHPRSGKPYFWVNDLSPTKLGLSGLPAVAVESIDAWWDGALPDLIRKIGGEVVATTGSNGPRSEDVDQAALQGKIEDVKRALDAMPNDLAYDDWIRMGVAIKAAVGDDGRELWHEFSAKYGDYKSEICDFKWDSFRAPFTIGADYIFTAAQPHGFSYAALEFGCGPVPNSGPRVDLPPAQDPIAAVVEELNQEYTFVLNGGDSVYVRRYRDQEGRPNIALTGFGDIKARYANRPVRVTNGKGGERLENPAEVWRVSPDRAEASGIVFRPGQPEMVGNDINFFLGWAVAPSAAGSCEMFKSHLRDVVCGSRADIYEWVMDWLANMLQGGRKPGSAIALRGSQGAGKSVVGEYIGMILGKHRVKVSQPSQVTGKFNAHQANCILLQAEEAFFSGDKETAAALKDKITSGTVTIERKGFDPVEMENHIRLLVTSNEAWVVPAALDDRRWLVLDVSDHRRKDKAYFDALHAEMYGDGPACLLHELQERRVDAKRLAVVPATDALAAQKIQSMPLEAKWLYDCAHEGRIAGALAATGSGYRRAGQEWGTFIPYEAFYASYADYYDQARGGGHKVGKRDLVARLHSAFPSLRIGKQRPLIKDADIASMSTAGGERVRCYVLPELADARAAIEQAVGCDLDWDAE